MKTFLFIFLFAAAAWAQVSLAPPQVGFMQDGAGSLRPVYGMAGNFLVGDALAVNVISSASSGSFSLVKTASKLLAIDGQGNIVASVDAPDGAAVFAFSQRSELALAYVLDANTMAAWRAGAFETVPFDAASLPNSTVLSIAAPDSEHAALIVQSQDGLHDLRILLSTGQIDSQTALEGITAPVLMLATGELVSSDLNGIVIRRPDGSERRIAAQLPQNFAFEQLGDGWIELRDLTSALAFAVRISDGREQLYQLPEVDQ